MRRHLLALLVCVLLCLMVLPGTASADSGPKPAVTITVVNALAGSTTWICSSPTPATMQTSIRQTTTPIFSKGCGTGRWTAGTPPWREAPAFLCSEICGRGGRYPSFYLLRPAPRLSYRRLRPRRGLGHGRALYPHGVLHPSDVRLGDQLHYKGHLPGGVLRHPVFIHPGAHP